MISVSRVPEHSQIPERIHVQIRRENDTQYLWMSRNETLELIASLVEFMETGEPTGTLIEQSVRWNKAINQTEQSNK